MHIKKVNFTIIICAEFCCVQRHTTRTMERLRLWKYNTDSPSSAYAGKLFQT